MSCPGDSPASWVKQIHLLPKYKSRTARSSLRLWPSSTSIRGSWAPFLPYEERLFTKSQRPAYLHPLLLLQLPSEHWVSTSKVAQYIYHKTYNFQSSHVQSGEDWYQPCLPHHETESEKKHNMHACVRTLILPRGKKKFSSRKLLVSGELRSIPFLKNVIPKMLKDFNHE